MSALQHIVGALYVDTYAADPVVPSAALLSFTEEADYIKARRERAISALRSGGVSKYVLDGANVQWSAPSVLRKAT
jgi:hypothetical protein